MKTILSTLLIWLVVSCTQSQPNSSKDFKEHSKSSIIKEGYIQMRINVKEENKHFYDDNTTCIIDCISDKVSFTNNSANFTLILHPNKEYILIFKRIGCINKRIFVSTMGISKFNSYNINTSINLLKGINPPIDDLYGKLTFNPYNNDFEQQLLTSKTKNDENKKQ